MTPKGVDVSWQMENSESDDSDKCGDKMDVHSGKLDTINKLLILEGHKPLTMKFIPTRYREAQSDSFGKRGISWHISVCLRKTDNRLEAQTFIHIIESGLQDSETVVLIMEHVLRSLKLQHPEITSAYSGKIMPDVTTHRVQFSLHGTFLTLQDTGEANRFQRSTGG